MAFHPDEVLFSPTARCNLACPHCDIPRPKASLSPRAAKKFLLDCRKNGINRIGFTGGEPFLARQFLYSIVKFAVKEGFLFTRIMTNGVSFRDGCDLRRGLEKLFKSGYDGSICVSVDAYHRQDLKKLAGFIKSARIIWRRPDIVSIVYVTGRNSATKEKLERLAQLLGARLSCFGGTHPVIRSTKMHNGRAGLNLPYHIKISKISLSPVGKAGRLKYPWDGRWFRSDMCEGPGNVFLVEPSGEVKPCCGYASELGALSIGNIEKDSVSELIKNIRQNRFVYAIFTLGLSRIRKGLVKCGIKFPGKTSDSCFFCRYILTVLPRPALLASLEE